MQTEMRRHSNQRQQNLAKDAYEKVCEHFYRKSKTRPISYQKKNNHPNEIKNAECIKS